MHESAYIHAANFRAEYLPESISELIVLDVGSYDVNGTLAPIFEGANYIGVDQCKGPNVTLVAEGSDLPFKNNYFDACVSSSCFEHDPEFWTSFLEICRVTKPGGFIYINAPSNGPYHAHPIDCWRFLSDSWLALSHYATRNGFPVALLQSYIGEPSPDSDWEDSVGIYQRS